MPNMIGKVTNTNYR